MHVITQKRIWEAMERYPRSAHALESWYRLIKGSRPSNFADLKKLYNSVDKVGHYHVFNIHGNNIRLIAIIRYQAQSIMIKAILSHKEYDKDKWKE